MKSSRYSDIRAFGPLVVFALVLALAPRPADASDPCKRYIDRVTPDLIGYLECYFGHVSSGVTSVKSVTDLFDQINRSTTNLPTSFQRSLVRLEHGVEDIGKILGEEEQRYTSFTTSPYAECNDLVVSFETILQDLQTAADLSAQILRKEMEIAALLASLVPESPKEVRVATSNIDPKFFLDRLDRLDSTRTKCALLFPLHELLAELGQGQCVTGDPALCIPHQLETDLQQVLDTLQGVLDAFNALEAQIQQEERQLCSEFAKLAGLDPLHPPTTEVGWEEWQSYASILRAIGTIGQEIGVALQGIGDISIDGITVGASVAAEGTIREGIDYASAIGRNIEQVSEDVQWLGQRLDGVISFCRSDLNLKLTVCMLQGTDYQTCKQQVASPEDYPSVEFGF